MLQASNRTSVILCCAQEDAVHLRPLVTHLEGEDYKARLIEGIEDDPYLLGSALDRQLGPCVVVACLSDAIGPSQFRRIEGVYSARKGPDHWLETIFVEPDETLAMAEGVRAALEKTKAKQPDLAHKPTARMDNPMRDVVGVTSLSAVGTNTDSGGEGSSASMRSAALGFELGAEAEGTAGLGNPAPVSADELEISIDEPPAEDPAGGSQSQPAMASESMVEGKAQTPGWVAPVLFLIFLAVAGTVVLLRFQDPGDDGMGNRGAPSLEAGEPAGAAGESPEPGEVRPGQSAAGAGGEAGAGEAGAGEQPASDEAALIVEAIESGELRAVDLILIAKTSELSAWRDASNRCRTQSVNGVRGWRLPSLDELKTIRKARMVTKGARYWSSTLATQVGDGKDHVYVLDVDAGSIDPMAKDASEVRVLCVRPALSAP